MYTSLSDIVIIQLIFKKIYPWDINFFQRLRAWDIDFFFESKAMGRELFYSMKSTLHRSHALIIIDRSLRLG